jgi:cellobiose-specific phosphotransferase system component IIC
MSRSSVASRPSSADSNPSTLFARFERRLRQFGELAFVAAVSEALPRSFFVLAAAFAVILGIQARGASTGDETLGLRLASALLPAFGIMAFALVILLAVSLVKRTHSPLAPLMAGSVAAFLLALPRPFGPDALHYLRVLGPSGLFIAMLACGTTGAYTSLLRARLRTQAAGWAGAALATLTFGALFFAHISLAAEIDAAMQPIAHLGDTYVALVVIVLIETVLWTAGVHGPAVLAGIVTPVYLTMQMQNTRAFGMHAPLPYVVVVSLFLFVFPGGAGATLPLSILLAISRVPRLRRIGRVTLLPALFNINEPLLFGAPVVFNPLLALPFVIAPIVLATVSYAAIAAGFVARAAFYVPSMVPTLVSTYLATQDVRAIVLALFNIALALVIYYPFVRAYERHVAAGA